MPSSFGFSVPLRPVSVNARGTLAYSEWKAYVNAIANIYFTSQPITKGRLRFSAVFVYEPGAPIDADNILKPLQDALTGVVYVDDKMIVDTQGHCRSINDGDLIDLTSLPDELAELVYSGGEGVYIRVSRGRKLSRCLA